MKKLVYFFALILLFGASTFAQSAIALVLQDTTVGTATQQGLEKADNDSMKNVMATFPWAYDIIYRTPSAPVSYSQYKTIIFVETSFIGVARLPQAFRDSLKAFLNSGTPVDQKSFIVLGGDFAYNYGGGAGGANTDTAFLNMFKVKYDLDNGSSTEKKITGALINPGEGDSIVGTASNFYPDAISPLDGGVVLYRHAGGDSISGVGYDGANYNTAVITVDPRYVRSVTAGSGGNTHLLSGLLSFVLSSGGSLPVELTSFTASAVNGNVSLNWTTATEINNKGFSIERKYKDEDFKEIAFVQGKGSTVQQTNYSYSDKNLQTGVYSYRLKQVDFNGTYTYSAVAEADVTAPREFSLSQNYPNPFNPATVIKYSIPTDGFVTLSVYNTLGEKVETLVSGNVAAGSYEISFNASKLASGVYVYRLESGNFVSVKKMMLMK